MYTYVKYIKYIKIFNIFKKNFEKNFTLVINDFLFTSDRYITETTLDTYASEICFT